VSQKTAIEWTDLSWNPVHGCSIVSTECRNCYAMTLSLRYRQTLKPWTPANAAENVILKPHKLREPLRDTKDWRGLGDAARATGKRDGKLVFVNSMSDLFHEQVPYDFIAQVFQTMRQASRHTFQVLTKRPERMAEVVADIYASGFNYGEPLPNVWLGTSIGLRQFAGRAEALAYTPAAIRFISAEPLLGPLIPDAITASEDGTTYSWADGYTRQGLPFYVDGRRAFDWLIVGGESGSGHRPVEEEWVRDLRDVCVREGVAFFLKQWGGARPGGEALLDGREWREFPR
jgi:protein gp37